MPKPFSSLPALLMAAPLAMAVAGMAQAQTTRILPITFTGTVTTTAGDTLKLKQADGSYAAYNGALPDLPYVQGQSVKIRFKASVPNAQYYAINPSASMLTRTPDGRYRITLYSESSGLAGLTIPGIGTAGAPVVSGGIVATGNPKNGGGMVLALTLYYDPEADSYTIAPGSSFVAGYFSGPSWLYDRASGELLPCKGADCDPTGTGANLFGLTGNAGNTQVSAVNVPVLNASSGTLAGLYTVAISGSWALGDNPMRYAGEAPVAQPVAEPLPSPAPPVSAPAAPAVPLAVAPRSEAGPVAPSVVIFTTAAPVKRKAASAARDRR